MTHGPAAGYRLRTAFETSDRPCQGFFAGYAFDLEAFSIGPRLGACRGGFGNRYLEATSDELELKLLMAQAWDLPIVTVELGISAEGAILHETFETRGRAPDRTSAAVDFGVFAGASVDGPAGFYGLAEPGAQTYLFRLENENKRSSLESSFALQVDVGLGKHW